MLTIVLCLICVCQATQESNELLNLDSEYDKVEVFNFDYVEYLFFGYHVTFDEALVICLNYKAQLAVLNTKEKADFIARAMTTTLELGEFWIGAQSDNTDSWYWIDKKQKLNLDHAFYGDFKIWDSSGFSSNNDNCLTVYRKSHSTPSFVPLQCSKKRPFICQREIDRFGTKANIVDVIKVNDEEFTLYSARATWAEAVVQCRQKGLQIAEVKSKKVAQAVSMSMLRVRPDAMENVWIGGYLKNNSWEWLASSDEITINELWPNDTKLSTGCLLLDRHVCEDPVYVSAKCDRKRHILCQKPPIKLISKKPSLINVDGCSYWVGFYPLEWLDARRSCQAINASLVILDSPKIIDHMMTLMVDYKEELRHIWTDGYRRKTWHWSSTGEQIPTAGSFIPWCTAQEYTKNTNCLNLDRENHKTSVVYGLSCKKNQTYVCQPWKGHCVSHRVQEDLLNNSKFLHLYSSLANINPVKTPANAFSQNSSRETEEDVSYVYEDMSNMKKLHSTESYYTSSVAYSIPQVTYLLEQTTESTIKELKKFNIKIAGVLEEDKGDSVNETDIERVKLDQFGIKVVSAEVTTSRSEVKKPSETSTPKGTTNKIVTSPAKINNRTQATTKAVKDLKKNSSNMKSRKGDTNKIPPKVINKNVEFVKHVPQGKIKSLVTEKVKSITTPATTEQIDIVSSGGLYGGDLDYYDILSSKPENSEIKEPTEDYSELLKSLEASGKLSSLLNEGKKNSNLDVASPFSEILQKSINDEIQSVLKSKLNSELKQKLKSELENSSPQTPVDYSMRNSAKNVYAGSTTEPIYQVKSMDTKNMGLKNIEPINMGFENIGITKTPPLQRTYPPNLIPPYYAFEYPLKVEILDDGTGIPLSPIVPERRVNFEIKDSEKIEEKVNTIPQSNEKNDSSFDFQLSQFNPYDKDSMLQLGRFLKNMFVGKNPNVQQIDFNLIARRDISETNQVIPESGNKSLHQKNEMQDTNSQNDNPITTVITTTIETTTSQVANENKSSINCQKEVDNLKRSALPKTLFDNLQTEYLQDSCKNLPVSVSPPSRVSRMSSENRNSYSRINADNNENSESSLFNVFKDLVKGIRIDIKELQLKTYVSKFVRERLPNLEEFDFDSDSKKSWHHAFKKILNSLNGTAIRFHGERVQLRFGSFGYKKKSTPKFKSVTEINDYTTTKIRFKNPDLVPEGTHLISESQTHDRINDNNQHDQYQAQKIQNPWSLSDVHNAKLSDQYSLGAIGNPLNNTHENKHLFRPVQTENNDFINQKAYKMSRNKLNIRPTNQKRRDEVEEPDRLESNLKRWPRLRNTKEKLKKRKQIEEKESMEEDLRDFKSKMFSPSENWKLRALNSKEDSKNPKNKLSKKSITEANEENPFPDFPVIKFDTRRAEDSFDSESETIRVGRAAKRSDFRDESSVVSVYIVMKHQNILDDEKLSIPILELHVRMPANSLPSEEKHNLSYKTETADNDKIQDSEILIHPKNLESKIIEEAPIPRRIKINSEAEMTQKRKTTPEKRRKLKSRRSRKSKVQKSKKSRNQDHLKDINQQNMKSDTDLNYEKANDFLRNIIENITNFKSVPHLKRKRQLLYLALKYLRHVTDEKLRKQSGKNEKNLRRVFMQGNNKNRQFYKNSMPNTNLRVQVPPEVQNSWQPQPLYAGMDNRPLLFNPIENELNPNPGLFNQIPVFNYNTRRYDDMPFNIIKKSYNTRMRRNVELSKKSRLFLDNEESTKN